MKTKIAKKILAGIGAFSLVGATMMGAVAVPYPEPFVKDGMFNGEIVVGAEAGAQDIVGAVDVGASLQFALKKTTMLNTGATESTISEGFKIEKSGDHFNYDETVSDVLGGTSITEDDLPAILADGKYSESQGENKNSETYTQRLSFLNDTAKLVYAQDDDLAKTARDYLYVSDSEPLYTYELEFDSSIEYDATTEVDASKDLKTTTITIQGKIYTISDVALNGDVLDKLTLIAGDSVLWLTQNNPITKMYDDVEHTIEVVDVTDSEDACQVRIDNTVAIIDIDETKTINGIQIGVTDVRAIHAQLQDVDVCQIALGASELELEHTEEMKVDGVSVDGTYVTFDGTTGNFDGFSITYEPSNLDDDIYLKSGDEFIDPIFTSWKIVYGGLTSDYEEINAETSGTTSGTYAFENNGGKEVEIDVYVDETTNTVKLGYGDDEDEQMIGHGIGFTGLNNITASVGDVTELEGTRILASVSNGEAHIFEVINIDTGDLTLDIKDLTYGREYNDVVYTAPLKLGSFGQLNLTVGASSLTVANSIKGLIETESEGTIVIDTTTNVEIALTESYKVVDDLDGQEATITTVFSADFDDDEIEVVASANQTIADVEQEEDSDYQIEVTPLGTQVKYNDENKNSVEIKLASQEAYGNVYIAPLVAEVVAAENGIESYTLNKLKLGIAKLDTEVTGSENMIIVGGPCANSITASVMGLTYPTCGVESTIPEDAAIIKAIARDNGKVALVVAGWDAQNTRTASKVLANYDAYNLNLEVGNAYKVTGTSMSDVTVSIIE